MEQQRARIVISFLLLVCLAIGLIIFAVLTSRIIQTVRTLESLEEEEKHQGHTQIPSENVTQSGEFYSSRRTTKIPTTTRATTIPAPNYTIHLNNDTEGASGKVYIEYGDRVGFVCSDGFDDDDARVVCREKGYKRGFSYNLLISPGYERYTRDEPILSQLQCTGNETKLYECPNFSLAENVTESCTSFATVLCYDKIPYQFRLVNSLAPDSGQIEMYVDKKWGTFCAIQNFDGTIANLVCREMNYTGGIPLRRGTGGPVSRTQVWMPWISCYNQPAPKSLFDCELVLHAENIPFDFHNHWNNRYRNMYYACIDQNSPYAPAVHCFHT